MCEFQCLNVKKASVIVGTDEAAKKLRDPWLNMVQERKLPNPEKEARYKVYSWSSQQWYAPVSLVLTTDDENFIAVGLTLQLGLTGNLCFAATAKLDKGVFPKLKFVGEISTSGCNILFQIENAIKAFGNYNKGNNNCQDFANQVLKKFGLDPCVPNDRDSSIKYAVRTVGSVAALVLTVIFSSR